MKKKRIPGIIAVLLEVIISVIFMIFLFSTKMIPNKLLLFAGIGVLVFTIIVYLLTMNFKKKVRFVIGIVLIILITICYIVGGGYLKKGIDTLSDITKPAVEKTGIAVYVRESDKAETLEDTKGYTYGVLEALDRENTDTAMEQMSEVIGNIETKNYTDVSALVDGLEKGKEVDAIILNTGFMSLLESREDYETVKAQMKQVHVEEIEKKVDSVEEPVASSEIPKTFSVYISGIDSREGLVANSRSDVNIVATVNTETHQVLLVSTPRDYFVPLSISNGVPDKLTHAGIYGIDVSKDTLAMLYQTDIDYYFRVNFGGFEKIIDSLGGITIVSDYTFDSENVDGYSYVKGENQVNGAQALAFARERYAFSEGDRQRGKNQLHVIEGVIKKAMSPAILKNFSQTMESLVGSFETNIPYDVIAGLIRQQLSEGGEWSVESYSVDGSGATKVPYSMSMAAYVMIPDMNTVNTAIEKMNQVKEGITEE